MKECNVVMWSKISQLLGKFHGYNSFDLYRNSKSNLLNLIEKIICKEKCYYLPEKCFLSHGFELKKLMKKSLHDKYPKFESNVRPKLNQLAEDVGFQGAIWIICL